MAPSGPPAFELPLFRSAGASSSAVCTSCTPGTYSTSPGARGVRFMNGLCKGGRDAESETDRQTETLADRQTDRERGRVGEWEKDR